MDHDTEQSAPTGSMNQQEYNSKSMHMLRTKSRGHHHHFSPPSLEKSLPNIPIERGSVISRKTNHQCPEQAMAYHKSYNTAKSRHQNNQNADNCMHNKNIDDDASSDIGDHFEGSCTEKLLHQFSNGQVYVV